MRSLDTELCSNSFGNKLGPVGSVSYMAGEAIRGNVPSTSTVRRAVVLRLGTLPSFSLARLLLQLRVLLLSAGTPLSPLGTEFYLILRISLLN